MSKASELLTASLHFAPKEQTFFEFIDEVRRMRFKIKPTPKRAPAKGGR